MLEFFYLEGMVKNFEEYRLELEKYANNLDNNNTTYEHTMNVDALYDEALSQVVKCILMEENNVYDIMGESDLLNYEKWLGDEF